MQEKYMKHAIELAEKGEGFTNPNPLVGAVIVKEGRIIGEGWHKNYGGLHAERNALASLSESAEGAEMYVTLEPCCHYGKTPPCTDAIIKHRLSKVIIGSRDPNPEVAGKGVAILRSAGIEVVENFMKEECDRLNPVFFHYITENTPYVVMKYAMTADGKIATRTGESKWITGKESREYVHKLRHKYAGIMAGIGTITADDPMLNVRIPGLKSPVRIICDSNLRIDENSKICQTANKYRTIIACSSEDSEKEKILESLGIEIIKVPGEDGRTDLRKLMKILGEKGIDSILLEGGGTLNENALKNDIVNEIKIFIAPKIFGGRDAKTPVEGEGIIHMSNHTHLKLKNIKKIGEDMLLEYKVINK